MESAYSTPYTSAPSSPARFAGGGGCFYSAPTSPVHFIQSYGPKEPSSLDNSGGSFEFEFGSGSMSSADELFLNGQIRPMKMKFALPPLLDFETQEDEGHQDGVVSRGRDPHKSRSITRRRRKTRSLSPVSSSGGEDMETTETTPSSGRTSSKKWVFLKDLLNRSKSEGSNRGRTATSITKETPTNKKFWFSKTTTREEKATSFSKKEDSKPASERRGVGAPSAHYAARRAEKEEMKKKTYLPYRQAGLLGGCFVGFSTSNRGYYSYYYDAFSGSSRGGTLNPVSSR